jgi:NAD(P)-dependent dehydrogenase (short-subunit alcohol dehydrogenase family)
MSTQNAKVWLVTGCSPGFGRYIAEHLLEAVVRDDRCLCSHCALVAAFHTDGKNCPQRTAQFPRIRCDPSESTRARDIMVNTVDTLPATMHAFRLNGRSAPDLSGRGWRWRAHRRRVPVRRAAVAAGA